VQRPLDSASMAAEPSEGKKDKKPRPIPSPPPAPLATASLLVRGAAARVLGLRPGPAGGDLQPLWNAEPGNAKVTINIEGSSRSPFPKESQHSALIDAIEAATNELVQANAEISVFEMDKAAAEAKYGDAIHDGQSSIGNGKLRLAYVPGAALVEIPNNWSVCATTGAAGLVTFTQKEVGPDSKKKPDTMILLKRKQLMIRYEVSKKDTTSLSTGGDAPPSAEVVKELDSAAVRVVVPGVDTPNLVQVARIQALVVEGYPLPWLQVFLEMSSSHPWLGTCGVGRHLCLEHLSHLLRQELHLRALRPPLRKIQQITQTWK